MNSHPQTTLRRTPAGHRRGAALLLATFALVVLAFAFAAPAHAGWVAVHEFGSRGAGPGQFEYASYVVIDSDGNLYVTDFLNDNLQKFSPSGAFLGTLATTGSDPGQLDGPAGLDIDPSGNIWVVDARNYRVQKLDADGNFLLEFGSEGTGPGQFSGGSEGLVADTAGNVYVADRYGQRIEKFDNNGNFLLEFSLGSGPGQFNWPIDFAIDAAGDLYISDALNNRVQKFTPTGSFISTFGTAGSDPGQLNLPLGVEVDGDGNIVVVDNGNRRVERFSPSGTFLDEFGSPGSGPGELNAPYGVAIDAAGAVWVVDTFNFRLQRFVEDVAAPVITITTPTDGATYSAGQSVLADYSCQEVGVAPPRSCEGPVADGEPIDTSAAGTYEFTVDAADDVDNQSSQTHSYTVVDQPPAATADSYSTDEDTNLNVAAPGVLGNDTDPEGGSLNAGEVTGPAHGSLALNADGSFSFTPDANFHGSDSFTYVAVDEGGGESAETTVTITVNSRDDFPVATDDAYLTNEDTALNVPAPGVVGNDTDVDGDVLTASLRTAAEHGTAIVNADGSFTYTPATNFNGTDSFTYKLDGGPLKKEPITATVTITVNAVNDAPIAVDDAYVTNEDTPLSVHVLDNDSDVEGSALTTAVVTGPSIGSVVLNPDQSFTYTPDANANGSDSFTYRASDGAAQSNVATVTITVVPVNDAPVAVNDASTTGEDTTVDINVALNDTDVDNANADLRAVSVSAATGGTATLQPDGRTVRFVPAANANSLNTPGGFSFTYRAGDGALTSANTATVTITVNPVNDAPLVAPIPSQSGRWGNVVTVDADAIDVDVPADTLTYSLATAPSGAGIDAATGVVTWTPTEAQVGTANFVVRVDDGGTPNLSAQTSFTVTVTRRPTLLVDSGDRTGQFSDPATVRATLTDNGGGALQGQPVSGKSVIFTIGSQTTAATTNGSGVAQGTITLNQPAASPGVVGLFAGDGAYLAATDVEPFTITPESATVAWSGSSLVVAIGSPVSLSGTVAEAADGNLGNRLDATQLRFTVRRNGNGTVAGTCTAPVTPTGPGAGAGMCPVNLGIGLYTVTIELVANGYYAAPPATSPTIIVVSVL